MIIYIYQELFEISYINNFQEKKIIIIIISLILLNENDKIKFLKIINYINILLK